LFAVGAGVGCGPRVYVYNSDNSIGFQFMAYDVSFEGEVRVATGDVNGDGVDDIITGAGPSGGPHVKVFSGVDRALLASFFAYDASFTGGLFVGAGDINGDGRDDIITGADAGGGPHVKVFDATNLACIRSFFAYSPEFTGGVRVASGDVNGDETDDIITGAGPGGGPHVCVYSGTNNALLRSFYAYDPSFTGGVYVAGVDLSLDGISDIATGAGTGGGPHVQIYNGTNLALIGSFFAYASNFTSGVRVGSADINGDGREDLLTSPGPGMISLIREFDYNRTLIGEFDAFGPMFLGGAYVG
jgi:FG-GAP repeat protein